MNSYKTSLVSVIPASAPYTSEDDKYRMRCPHCHAELTLKEAITILNGSGTRQMAKVRRPDGKIAYVNAGDCNPLLVEILE
jgi:hypothetical protein